MSDIVDQGPKLRPSEFMSPEHQRAVLEGVLIAIVKANLDLIKATAGVTVYGMDDSAEVFKDRFENLKRTLQDNMPMLEKCDMSRADRAEMFGPVVDEADALEAEWISRFQSLEISG